MSHVYKKTSINISQRWCVAVLLARSNSGTA